MERVVDGIATTSDGLQPKDVRLTGIRVGAGHLAERSFWFEMISWYKLAFENDLGFRRNVDVDRFALDCADALAEKTAGEPKLVDARARRIAGDNQMAG